MECMIDKKELFEKYKDHDFIGYAVEWKINPDEPFRLYFDRSQYTGDRRRTYEDEFNRGIVFGIVKDTTNRDTPRYVGGEVVLGRLAECGSCAGFNRESGICMRAEMDYIQVDPFRKPCYLYEVAGRTPNLDIDKNGRVTASFPGGFKVSANLDDPRSLGMMMGLLNEEK